MPRATRRRLACVRRTVTRYFRLPIDDSLARKVIHWDEDGSFVNELAEDGHLDTAPRDYFSMALIEVLMPGAPTVQDDLISTPLKKWHWPLIGSSPAYHRAFESAWRKAKAALRSGSDHA